MKKTAKISIGIIGAIIILAVIIAISGIGGGKIADGTYRVTNCEAYPDAYIVVEGNKVQFYNIDLNALYRDKQRKEFEGWMERGVGANMTEEQIERVSDLNALFVSNAWEIDYDLVDNNKQGTFTYVHFCIVKDARFGLVLQYDALHKTIQLNDADPEKVFVFKK